MNCIFGRLIFILLFTSALSACHVYQRPTAPASFTLSKQFPSETNPSVTFTDSIIASVVTDHSHEHPRIIVPVSNGTIAALDKDTGALIWQLKVPTPSEQEAHLVATPTVIDDKLIVVYQCLERGVRVSHHLAVINLTDEKLDEHFPILTIDATQPSIDGKGSVKFNPPTAYSHAALKHLARQGAQLGFVYAAFGNAGDTQPFHGWVFEIDLDTWQRHGAKSAIKNVLLTTPEAQCPSNTEYGTQEMICGGGVWVPSGLLLSEANGEAELLIPTGNGQINPARHDYANALLRVRPGLNFDAGCNTQLCADFDPNHPDLACLASCQHLFVPRLAANNAPLKPPNHECDDKEFSQCLAWMDYDLGANTPIKVALTPNKNVVVQAGKDGSVYLLDAEHLGTQYDRLQIAKPCGSPTDLCKLSWAGMIVTQPVQTRVAGDPVVIIPTFSPDETNIAGLVALKIVQHKGQPKFEPFWRFPTAQHPKARRMFRSHPSFPLLTTQWGQQQEPIIWIVDIGNPGTLYGIRAKDGVMVVEQNLQGSGRQLSMPLLIDNTLYLASKAPNTGQAMLEAYRILSTLH